MKKALNIALIGYGKMGQIIEKMALERGHKIGLIIKRQNIADLNKGNFYEIDVAIEFTTPESAPDNLRKLASCQTPTICGTTGWLDDYDEISRLFEKNDSAFLYASNFSLGVNLFFALNKHLAKLMNTYTQYQVKISESHHVSKKDAPSGTAVTIAQQLISSLDRKSNWTMTDPTDEDIKITAYREGDVKGSHTVEYKSDIDEIVIAHHAHSRAGFALGAIIAAEWLADKKGLFHMNDVLGLTSI